MDRNELIKKLSMFDYGILSNKALRMLNAIIQDEEAEIDANEIEYLNSVSLRTLASAIKDLPNAEFDMMSLYYDIAGYAVRFDGTKFAEVSMEAVLRGVDELPQRYGISEKEVRALRYGFLEDLHIGLKDVPLAHISPYFAASILWRLADRKEEI